MRLDRYELLGINRRLHDPAQRLGGKWLLALIVLAAIAAVGVAFAYCMGIAYALSAIPALGVVGIWWSVPIGWFLADAAGLFYYLSHKKQLYALPKRFE